MKQILRKSVKNVYYPKIIRLGIFHGSRNIKSIVIWIETAFFGSFIVSLLIIYREKFILGVRHVDTEKKFKEVMWALRLE